MPDNQGSPVASTDLPQGAERGVLLYYYYIEIPDPHILADWYRALCERLGLKGRVRVAPDGVNVTVGGPMASLQDHIEQVKYHPFLSKDGTSIPQIDFKLAASPGPRSHKCTVESGFDNLKVSICKALITLGKGSYSPSSGAPHLKPEDFHGMISAALEGEAPPTVLLDVRNIYETRVGHFVAPGVRTLDPKTRQLSDLPAWMERELDEMRGKRVLMYCTGGVRCESVSAYLRSYGPEFQDVYQLSGGIQRYLEAFPDGGYFHGENFVFDERVTVGPALGVKEVVGRCISCHQPWGDYSSRLRCCQCRLLILVCDGCKETPGQGSSFMCELCTDKSQQESNPKGKRRSRRSKNVSPPPPCPPGDRISEAVNGSCGAPQEQST